MIPETINLNPILLVLLVLIIIAGFVLFRIYQRRSRARQLRDIRSYWGQIPPDRIGVERARTYFEFNPQDADSDHYVLDEGSWKDLDLDEVFLRLDRCTSAIGSQVLYRHLRLPRLSGDVPAERRQLAQLFSTDSVLREKVQLGLHGLRGQHAGRVVEMLWEPLPDDPNVARAAIILSAAGGISLALAAAGVGSWVFVILIFFINTLIHFAHQRQIEYMPLAQLGSLLGAASRLSEISDERLEKDCRRLRGALDGSKLLRRRLAFYLADDGFGLLQYIKIVFLIDVLAHKSVLLQVRHLTPQLRILFEVTGSLDAAIAMASFLTSHPNVCRPSFSGEVSRWGFKAACHPLLASPVPNDFHIGKRAALITGSNMSGKTTFLKCVGVNAVLAQAFDIALAESYTMPYLRVLTAIGRADNIIEGRSYYLAEVESILRLVRAAESSEYHLLMADEVFRGTNPDERVAGATEVLRYLGQSPHLILAATHDLELVHLLAEEYDSYHFSESLDSGGLCFDYRIRPGACTNRNAINLLQHVGYPQSVVDRARLLAASLQQTKRYPG
jgi:hypothetical protein